MEQFVEIYNNNKTFTVPFRITMYAAVSAVYIIHDWVLRGVMSGSYVHTIFRLRYIHITWWHIKLPLAAK